MIKWLLFGMVLNLLVLVIVMLILFCLVLVMNRLWVCFMLLLMFLIKRMQLLCVGLMKWLVEIIDSMLCCLKWFLNNVFCWLVYGQLNRVSSVISMMNGSEKCSIGWMKFVRLMFEVNYIIILEFLYQCVSISNIEMKSVVYSRIVRQFSVVRLMRSRMLFGFVLLLVVMLRMWIIRVVSMNVSSMRKMVLVVKDSLCCRVCLKIMWMWEGRVRFRLGWDDVCFIRFYWSFCVKWWIMWVFVDLFYREKCDGIQYKSFGLG